MSIVTLDIALSRIESAPENSPIAVFACNKPERLETVFARTAYARWRITHAEQTGLLGVFCKTDDLAEVKHTLFRNMLKRRVDQPSAEAA